MFEGNPHRVGFLGAFGKALKSCEYLNTELLSYLALTHPHCVGSLILMAEH